VREAPTFASRRASGKVVTLLFAIVIMSGIVLLLLARVLAVRPDDRVEVCTGSPPPAAATQEPCPP
jgi:hypothetical protein